MPRIPFTEFQFNFENGSSKVKIDMAYPTPEEYKKKIIIDNAVRIRKEVLYKSFKVSKDYKNVTVKDFGTYAIPEFYNKEMLMLNDEKTWSMVFISIFQDEIAKARKEASEYIETAIEYQDNRKKDEFDL